MNQPMEIEVLAARREALSGDTRLSRRLSLLAPTKKLARLLAGSGASSLETRSRSLGKPTGGLSAHCSRQISGAQVIEQGDSCDATAALP